jgi:hypothetical protein
MEARDPAKRSTTYMKNMSTRVRERKVTLITVEM